MGNKLPLFNLRNNRYSAHWYADKREYPKLLLLNYQIRKILKEKSIGNKFEISKVVINGSRDIRVDIHTLKPGVILGKSSSNITSIKNTIIKKTGLDNSKLHLNLVAATKPELDARLIALKIANDLEKRRSYNYSMRSNAEDAMRFGALGVQIKCSGRLNGADIAKDAQEKRGKISKNTIRANMYYAQEGAETRSGMCSVKVWLNLPLRDLKTRNPDHAKYAETSDKLDNKTSLKRNMRRGSENFQTQVKVFKPKKEYNNQ